METSERKEITVADLKVLPSPMLKARIYLFAAFAYYQMDMPIMSDHTFDWLAGELLHSYARIPAELRELITEEDLEAGTLLLPSAKYPSILRHTFDDTARMVATGELQRRWRQAHGDPETPFRRLRRRAGREQQTTTYPTPQLTHRRERKRDAHHGQPDDSIPTGEPAPDPGPVVARRVRRR